MRNKLFYHPALKETSRQLRKNSTKAEITLWNQLKKKKIKGYDFHRQKPIGYYIVDFFCNELMLAIEVDGEVHKKREFEDELRTDQLEFLGINILRFTNEEVLYDLDSVIRKIETWIDGYTGC